MPPILSFLVLAFSACALRFFLRCWLRTRRLPPGPHGLPLLGNVWNVPKHYSWLTFTEWGKKHGDIVSFSVFGRTTIVLNSAKVANEILDKRSFNYSDRPRMVLDIFFKYDLPLTISRSWLMSSWVGVGTLRICPILTNGGAHIVSKGNELTP